MAKIEERKEIQNTTLLLAAFRGHASVVKLLLDHGANIEAKDKWQSTALEEAKAWNRKEVVRILEEYSHNQIVG